MFSSFWKLFGYNSQPAQTNPPQPAVVPKPQERINEEVHHPKPIQKQPSIRNVVDYESNFEDDLNALGSKEELKTKGMLLMSHLGENSFGKVVFSLPDIIPIGTVFVTERGNHVERISHGEVKLTTPPKAEPISKQRILHIPKADLESKEQQLSELNEKSRQEEKQEEQNKELFEKLGKKPHYFSSSSFLRNELEKIKHKGLESNKQEYEQKLEELEKDLQTQSKLGKTEIEEKKKEELKKLEEERIKEETLRKKKEEENKRAEEKKQLDELRRKQEEEKIKQKEVAEKKRKEEADRKQKEDIERKRKEEDELKRKQEEEKIKQKEAAEKKRKEELEKQQKVKEEADKKLKEEAERKQKEEADKKRELEKKQKEAEKKQKEEVDRKQKEREEDETFQSARKTSDPPRVESPDEESKPEEDNKSKQTKKFGSQMKCEICGKTVYPAEKLAANDKWYHPQCFKCSVCKGQLKLGNYAALNGALYCKPHFKQLFMAKGNYSEGFGHLKPQQEYELSKQIKDGTLDTESNDEANKKKEELKKALEEKQKRQMEAKKKQEEAKLKQKEEVENRKKEEEEEKKILEEIESEPSTPTSTESRFATASRAKQPNKRPPTRKHIQSISYAEGKDISKQLGEGERMSKLELDAVSKSLDAAMKRRDDEKRIIEQEERMREEKERKRRDSEASQNLLMFSTAIKKKVETTYEKHLIHIKGKRSVKSRRIEVSAKAMNKGDVYILDAGKTLYIWVGPQANRMEQAKALDITTRMKNKERTGAEILTIDKNSDQYADRFWQELGGSESELSDQSEDDVAYEQSVDQAYKLYRVEGKRAIPVEAKKLTVQLLDHEKAYILDTETELYVWIGKKSSDSDRSQAMKLAKQMLTEEVRPQWTDGVLKVERLVEGGETVLFKEKFTNWADSLMISVATPNTAKLNAAGSLSFLNLLLETKRLEKYDVTKLFIPSPKEEQVFGNGEVMIWIINGFDKVELPKNEYGRFFSGNCYIVQYKYVHRTGTLGDLFKFIIFFWQGMDSSKNDRGTSGLLTTELTKAIQKNNEVSQSRIVQNKETAQFKTIFKGKFVVSKGTRNASVSSKSLYEVREANSPFINAIEAPLETNSLHSHGIFYVINDKNIFVWIGSGSSKESQSNASSFASILKENRELKIVYEEKEPKEFWELLGGKGEYAKGGYLLKNDKKTRFFDCSESTGIYEIDEIFSFAQEDLLDTDTIILDAFYEVYVWAGNKCSEYVKKMSMETALEYSKSIEDGRPKNIPIWLVFPGSEPVFFSCHFSAWNREKAQNTKKNETSPILVQEALKKYSQTYSLDELKNNPPKELDQTKLEKNYLSDEEFVKTFNMNKDEFSKVPDWKKLEIKKSIGLY